MRSLLLGLAVALAAGEAAAQDAADAKAPSPYAAAGWCVVRDASEAEAEAPGCDVGVAIALQRWGRSSVVGVLGAETLGVGLAWTAYQGDEGGPVIAVGAGVVARYGAGGIDATELHPAIGCTLSFGRSQEP